MEKTRCLSGKFEFCSTESDLGSAVESAEIGKTCSDKDSVPCRGRALLVGSVNTFCSKAECFDWLAEQIFSKCEICVESCLSLVNPAELDKTCLDRTSVWLKGRALSGGPIGTFTLKADRSDRSVEKNLSKCEICAESRLSSADLAESGKICSDRTPFGCRERALSGGPVGMFNSTPECCDGPAEGILSKIGRVLSGILTLPKFARFKRPEDNGICNSCSITARGYCEADSSCSGCSVSLLPCKVNNCCEKVAICKFWVPSRLCAELACE